MRPFTVKRLAATLLALLLTAGIAPVSYASMAGSVSSSGGAVSPNAGAVSPNAGSVSVNAGSVSYRNYVAYDPYLEGDNWTMDSFYDGNQYWNSRDYWEGDFYYRDNYYWGPDLFITDPRMYGNAMYLTSPNVDAGGSVIQNAALRQVGIAASLSGDAFAMLRIVNGEVMTNQAMQGLDAEAKAYGKLAVVCAYTMLPGQRQHQTRLYFEPQQFAASGEDVKLGVFSDAEWLYKTKQDYLDQFANHVELIRFAQRDEFPASVQVYALIDLSKLDKTKLRFYSVNRDTGVVTEIKSPDYSFAENGKLTFHTKLAGDVLIADRQLTTLVKSNGWISDARIAAEQPQAIADAAAAAAKKAADLAAQANANAQAAAGTDQAKAKQDAAKAAQKAADDARKAADEAAAAAAAFAAAQ